MLLIQSLRCGSRLSDLSGSMEPTRGSRKGDNDGTGTSPLPTLLEARPADSRSDIDGHSHSDCECRARECHFNLLPLPGAPSKTYAKRRARKRHERRTLLPQQSDGGLRSGK